MILVTVGTHEQPFDRLVRAAEDLASDHVVHLQKGTSDVPTPRCVSSAWWTPQQLNDAMNEATVVICHAGPATIFEVLSRGSSPIVVPRSAVYGEHVDAHQVEFSRFMGDRLHVVEDPADLRRELALHAQIVASLSTSFGGVQRSDAFAADLGRLVERLTHRDRAPTGSVRDRFRGLRRWWTRRQ